MIKPGWKYKARRIQHRDVAGDKHITSFTISDKVEDGDTQKYQYYKVTVWDNVDIQNDDDEVRIRNFRDITAKEYKGKVYIGFTADAEVAEKKQEEPKKKERDTSTDLPFDI